jgi:hypothetical protein
VKGEGMDESEWVGAALRHLEEDGDGPERQHEYADDYQALQDVVLQVPRGFFFCRVRRSQGSIGLAVQTGPDRSALSGSGSLPRVFQMATRPAGTSSASAISPIPELHPTNSHSVQPSALAARRGQSSPHHQASAPLPGRCSSRTQLGRQSGLSTSNKAASEHGSSGVCVLGARITRVLPLLSGHPFPLVVTR